jgi:SAM-dependent methyltransferase
MSNPATPLPFTGERFTPECVREIWYEHLHRYAFAHGYSQDKRVLDAACGEGYGSALLADNAHRVLGVDIAEEAVGHARVRYGERANLEFLCCDVTALDALPDASFDLIVSFETLEHVHAQERMLAGFKRLLAPGGLLLISSPDKRTYSDLTGYVNEHHVRELYRDELETLLRSQFEGVQLLAQKLLFQSVLWDPDRSDGRASATTLGTDGRFEPRLHYDALYYLALCTHARADLPDSAGAQHLFGDQVESVYAHYNQEIRRHIAAGHRLIAQEAELDHLRQRLCKAEAALASLQSQGRNP